MSLGTYRAPARARPPGPLRKYNDTALLIPEPEDDGSDSDARRTTSFTDGYDEKTYREMLSATAEFIGRDEGEFVGWLDTFAHNADIVYAQMLAGGIEVSDEQPVEVGVRKPFALAAVALASAAAASAPHLALEQLKSAPNLGYVPAPILDSTDAHSTSHMWAVAPLGPLPDFDKSGDQSGDQSGDRTSALAMLEDSETLANRKLGQELQVAVAQGSDVSVKNATHMHEILVLGSMFLDWPMYGVGTDIKTGRFIKNKWLSYFFDTYGKSMLNNAIESSDTFNKTAMKACNCPAANTTRAFSISWSLNDTLGHFSHEAMYAISPGLRETPNKPTTISAREQQEAAMHANARISSRALSDLRDGGFGFMDYGNIKSQQNMLRFMYKENQMCTFPAATSIVAAMNHTATRNELLPYFDHSGLFNGEPIMSIMREKYDNVLFIGIRYDGVSPRTKITRVMTATEFYEATFDENDRVMLMEKGRFFITPRVDDIIQVNELIGTLKPSVEVTIFSRRLAIIPFVKHLFRKSNVMPFFQYRTLRYEETGKMMKNGAFSSTFGLPWVDFLSAHYWAELCRYLLKLFFPAYGDFLVDNPKAVQLILIDVSLMMARKGMNFMENFNIVGVDKIKNAVLRAVGNANAKLGRVMPYIKGSAMLSIFYYGQDYVFIPGLLHNLMYGEAATVHGMRSATYLYEYFYRLFIIPEKNTYVYYGNRVCYVTHVEKLDESNVERVTHVKLTYRKKRGDTVSVPILYMGSGSIPVSLVHALLVKQEDVVYAIANIMRMTTKDLNAPPPRLL